MRALSISFKITTKEVNLYDIYKNRTITLKKEFINACWGVWYIDCHRCAGLYFACDFLFASKFSFTQNWVSDLTGMGYSNFENVSRPIVSSPVTEILVRSGLIISGILAIVFSIGLFYDDDAPSHRLGAVFGVVGSGALCASGIFPAPAGVIHLVARYVTVHTGCYRRIPHRGGTH